MEVGRKERDQSRRVDAFAINNRAEHGHVTLMTRITGQIWVLVWLSKITCIAQSCTLNSERAERCIKSYNRVWSENGAVASVSLKKEKKQDPRHLLAGPPNWDTDIVLPWSDTTWTLTSQIRVSIRLAETRLSDLICQNDCQALEFKGYGKNFITSHQFSPDAFVQMAFQAAYFGLYGTSRQLEMLTKLITNLERTECTYEPAMTKAFLHGRTEAIRTVQPESVEFTKTFFSEPSNEEKIIALRRACERRVALTKQCSQGLGQDRHIYALYCLYQRQLSGNLKPLPDDPVPNAGTTAQAALPSIFADPGWNLLTTSILSTALRLFGFGPVAADGYGIGYIIKENGISIVASSRHLQTRRYLDTLQSYLLDVQRILVQLYLSANERPAPFLDHSGILRDSKTGRPINGSGSDDGASDGYEDTMSQSFFLMSNPNPII
ncbi:hypothetical protein JVT61DRAFT_12112 [Boletus reticuloceps]|uniref:Choline/carnitine acyltransferase domain-containing protein n=1 Tax=Boletus reticuloceps TaxID=495285 RepID=A0A8I2YEB1_9AGAM|nr:hypothetical protein JVT61DRAFT_12112 [Boletus reticuloceps]